MRPRATSAITHWTQQSDDSNTPKLWQDTTTRSAWGARSESPLPMQQTKQAVRFPMREEKVWTKQAGGRNRSTSSNSSATRDTHRLINFFPVEIMGRCAEAPRWFEAEASAICELRRTRLRCSAISECAELCAACIIGWIIHFVGWHYLTSIPLSGSRAGSTVMRGSIIGIRAVGTSVGAPGGPLAVHCLGLCGLPWPWCIVLILFYFYSFFRVCYMVKRIHLQQPFFPLWRIIIQALLFRH